MIRLMGLSGLSLVVLVGCDVDIAGIGAVSSQQAIVNGTAIGVDDHPTSLALVVFDGGQGGSYCSATLIAADVILTAAHCAEAGIDYLSQNAEVWAINATNLEFIDQVPAGAALVSGFDIEPSYRGGENPTADIAVGFLANPVVGVVPMPLLQNNELDHVRSGQSIIAVGWGLQQANGSGGQKRAATTVTQVVTPQLLGFGFPIANVTTVNKCNGDSGGPSYLNVGGAGVRVVGVASRSDCASGTLDVRPDAFRAYLEDAMSLACDQGRRSACDEPGLPTPSALGLPALPAPGAVDRALPPSIEVGLAAASNHLAPCFNVGVEPDEIAMIEGGFLVGLGADACTANDVDTGAAYLNCLSAASCADYGNQTACQSEFADVSGALQGCGDGVAPDRPAADELSEPLRSAVETYCERVEDCFEVPAEECLASVVPDYLQVEAFGCERLNYEYAAALLCTAEVSCDAFQEPNPNGCFDDRAFEDATTRCEDLSGFEPVGEGEGEGDGEGEGENDDDEDDDEDDDDNNSDDPEPTPEPKWLGCASGVDGAVAALSLLLLMRRRQR